jgi:hypothetical protein
VRAVSFDRGTMRAPALSPRNARETREKTSGPVIDLVKALAGDAAKLDAYRAEMEALLAEYFDDNVIRQGYLMTRAVKV